MASEQRSGTSGDGDAATMEELCASKDVLISTGPGGVGKTTTAAALAATAAANLGIKVLVLTVDPARRLANALGMERFGNVETPVPASAFAEAGVDAQGELWAAMLDTKESWDELIRLHAPDAVTREAILANPLYQNITGKFVQSHDYVAMERLYEIHSSGRYDLIVVDTPPTRNAVDFLEAPERMAEFFSSPLLRWLVAPSKSRVVGFASKPFYTIADRILGGQFLSDIAEFFTLFQTMREGFVERARAVTDLMGGPSTSFVVVSTLEVAPAREAAFFLQLLGESGYQVDALVLNKVLPAYFRSRDGAAAATALSHHGEDAAQRLRDELGGEWPHAGHVLGEIGRSFSDYQVVARREAEQRRELALGAQIEVSVPFFDDDIHTLAGLLRLGERIWR